MPRQSEYQGVSRRARILLAGSENSDVDFKEAINGLDASDLVAFANSVRGGAILIGVREVKDASGSQRGEPIGCKIGDSAKLQILNKALSCTPPIAIEIITENIGARPFFRVEISPGSEKPYCTPSGTYKIRADGRNRPILPNHLLELFLEREAQTFGSRFRDATAGIEEQLHHAVANVSVIESTIQDGLSSIESELGWAVFHADDAESGVRRVESSVDAIDSRIKKLEERVSALLAHLAVPDPVVVRAKVKLAEELERKFREDPDILKQISEGGTLRISGALLADLKREQSQAVMNEVLSKLIPELPELLRQRKGAAPATKKPSKRKRGEESRR